MSDVGQATKIDSAVLLPHHQEQEEEKGPSWGTKTTIESE
jgi:hypothetical protein